jgi:2-keto-4-pentenoate hydratase
MRVVLAEGRWEVARMRGTALLGHPLNALAWLVADLRAQGRRLRAGEHVALGSFSSPQRPQPGQVWTAIYEGLAPSPVAVSVRMR